MNYSFVDKYKASDFIPQSNSKLYNEVNASNSTAYTPTNYYWSDYSQSTNNWARKILFKKVCLKVYINLHHLENYFFHKKILIEYKK